MDVRHYFKPVDFSMFVEKTESIHKYFLGYTIEKLTTKLTLPNIHKLELAVIGIPFKDGQWEPAKSNAPDKIRSELYRLVYPGPKLNIVDFGNLKKTKSQKGAYLALRDIIEYLNELGITTILLGGSQDLSFGIGEAFKGTRFFSFATVDAFLDVKEGVESFGATNYLTRLFRSNKNLFQFSLIGYQSHFVWPLHFKKIKALEHHLRLGLLREDIAKAEPILRNSDVLSFDLGAIKFSEAPATRRGTPNGLRSEEACQLAKYAGFSERLKVFGLFEFDTQKEDKGQTSKLAAQIIWYFLDGFVNRQNGKSNARENNIVYKVDVKDVDSPIVFYNHKETAQWWFGIQLSDGSEIKIACSEEEYREASNNEIPELWLKYVQKTDNI
ncbi:MAG: arginase family protein [Prolixibacteraceae bacterium]|nr:arginase family protein [Prolixibacteraceae bacterium]